MTETEERFVLPPPSHLLSLEQVFVRLAQVAQKSARRPGKRSECPEVGAILARKMEDGKYELIAERAHHYTADLRSCTHAEEQAIRYCVRQGLPLHEATLFSTLEPCTARSDFRTPCTQLIDAVGIRAIYVGLLDIDSEIYGRAAVHLSRVNVPVHFLPRGQRLSLATSNANFLKRKRAEFDWRDLERRMPLVVSKALNESSYLATTHALFTLFDSGSIYWLNPQLPSLHERDRFQAVWAQGILNNTGARVYLLAEDGVLQTALRQLLKEDWAEEAVEELRSANHVCVGRLPAGGNLYRGVVLRDQGTGRCFFVSATPIEGTGSAVDALIVARRDQMGDFGDRVLNEVELLDERLKGSYTQLPHELEDAIRAHELGTH